MIIDIIFLLSLIFALGIFIFTWKSNVKFKKGKTPKMSEYKMFSSKKEYQNYLIKKVRVEIAREIFAEIEKAHENCIYINPTNNIGSLQVNKFEGMLTELKNKYTKEGKEI